MTLNIDLYVDPVPEKHLDCVRKSNTLYTDCKKPIESNWVTDQTWTLVVAVKTLTEESFRDFRENFDRASKALSQREAKVKKVYDDLESDLTLLGIY